MRLSRSSQRIASEKSQPTLDSDYTCREKERRIVRLTEGEDEMENPRGRMSGKRSNRYSGGIFAERNSYKTSLMVRRGRRA
jgi:hypothetical protein